MNTYTRERDFILSNIHCVRDILANIPPNRIITRKTYEARLAVHEKELADWESRYQASLKHGSRFFTGNSPRKGKSPTREKKRQA